MWGSSSTIKIRAILLFLCGCGYQGGLCSRDPEAKTDIPRFVLLQFQFAPVCARDIASNRQPQSGSSRLGSEEWLKDPRQDRRRDLFAAIRDPDLHFGRTIPGTFQPNRSTLGRSI